MNDNKNAMNKNINQNEIISKNKKLFLQTFKQYLNNYPASSQYKKNKKNFEINNSKKEEDKKIKINNILKTNNLFPLNKNDKKKILLSKEIINKNEKAHEDNLKKIKELEKILQELQTNSDALSKNLDQLNKEELQLKNDLKEKDEQEKNLTQELDNIKNINEQKNKEYLDLIQSNNIQGSIPNNNNINNNNHNNNNLQNEENIDDINNSEENINEENYNHGLNRIMLEPLLGQEIGDESGENNEFLPFPNFLEIPNLKELNEDLGPPMTFKQIEKLPVGKYPRKDIYDEKCILCRFNICFNDSITKLVQCQHIFHSECLGNFLINKQASKCPICKVSLI